MAEQTPQPPEFNLSKPLPEAQPGWDFVPIVNTAMVVISVLPVLPLVIIFALIFQGARETQLPAADLIFLLSFIGTGCAMCTLPVLIPAGWVLSHRRKQATGKPYRWWAYILAMILWVIFAIVTGAALFPPSSAR